jgi:hypothetical protein
MERTQVYLTREESVALDALAAERGTTRSHLIREAIDATYLAPRRSQRDRLLETLAQLGPLWRDRPDVPDGKTYVERIRGTPSGSPLDLDVERAGHGHTAGGEGLRTPSGG